MTTYREAGVDVEKAEIFATYVKEKIKKTFPSFSLIGLGGFASGVSIGNYKKPVIFTTTDGVGTKLKIAQELGVHHTVGIDLVAMNVNDILTTGADPLLFLDYIAVGKIELELLKEIVDGIIEGCKEAEVILVGGETAEMPGFYPEGVYDLAGFCVGIAEEEEIIRPQIIEEGDILVGFKSSGFHSNGYSLIRKVLTDKGIKLKDKTDFGDTVGELLLTPTRIYTSFIKKMKKKVSIKGLAHITGGGIPGNLIRILPKGKKAIVEKDKIPENPVFDWIQDIGKIPEEEMFKTFNMGVGMIAVVSQPDSEKILKILGEETFLCGYVEKGRREVIIL